MRGKAPFSVATLQACQDHPRLCGEKTDKGDKRIVNEGSPPPMRGKDAYLSSGFIGKGITPAYAGKRPNENT